MIAAAKLCFYGLCGFNGRATLAVKLSFLQANHAQLLIFQRVHFPVPSNISV